MAKYVILPLLLLLLLSCDSILSLSPGNSDGLPTSVKTTDTLKMVLTIKSQEINNLEEISAQFKLSNISDKVVVYDFPSACQYGYTVTKNNSTIFDSRKHLMCAAVLTQLKLEPAETKSFQISLDKFDINRKLDEGIYELQAFLLEGHTPQISTSFKVE